MQAAETQQAASSLGYDFASGCCLAPENAVVSPLNRIGYRMADAPTPPMLGSRQTGIDRAWALERELVERSGRGSSPWTKAEITRIKAGDSYKDLGYTGHHLNRVKDAPAWSGDPRNIVFLKQGKGQTHMKLGHPGGTRAIQPEQLLIDRESMLRSLGGGIVDGPYFGTF